MAKVRLSNGVVLEYEERGQGQPLLLLHGSGATWRMFEPQFESLGGTYRLIMPNLRGHGESSPLVDGTNYHEVMADDVKLFLEAIGIQGPIPVYGISMGAVVALRLAIKHPDCVSRLIPVCAYSEMPSVGPWLLKISNAIFSLFSMERILQLMFAAAYPLKLEGSLLTREVIAKSLGVDKATFFTLKTSPFVNFTEQLPRIQAPTLVIAGTRMKMEESASRLIAAQIPGARLALFEGATDPINLQRPEAHDRLVLDFLAG